MYRAGLVALLNSSYANNSYRGNIYYLWAGRHNCGCLLIRLKNSVVGRDFDWLLTRQVRV